MRGTRTSVGDRYIAVRTWQSDAEVAAIAVRDRTRVRAGLSRRVKHFQIRHRRQIGVDLGTIRPGEFVRSLDVACVPIRPINKIPILRNAKWIDYVTRNDDISPLH